MKRVVRRGRSLSDERVLRESIKRKEGMRWKKVQRHQSIKLDGGLGQGFFQAGDGSTLLWLLRRIPFTKLLATGATSLADASLLEGRVTLGTSPVYSSSWLLVGTSWASWWEDVTVILRVLMVVVSWRLVLLVWVSWALATTLVLAGLADLDLCWELSLAMMAGTAHTHADRPADQILTTSAGWDGEFVLVTVLALSALAVTGAVLVLWLLGWEARASLAAAVLALGASLIGTEGGTTAMAVAVDSHTDLLVDTLTLWWSRGEAPVGWVDLESMLGEECLSTLSRRKDWWLWWSILWDSRGGLGLLDLLSLDGDRSGGGFLLLAGDLSDGGNRSSVLSLGRLDAQDLVEKTTSTAKSLVGARARCDGWNGLFCCCCGGGRHFVNVW